MDQEPHVSHQDVIEHLLRVVAYTVWKSRDDNLHGIETSPTPEWLDEMYKVIGEPVLHSVLECMEADTHIRFEQ
jgi:hypothetical protein